MKLTYDPQRDQLCIELSDEDTENICLLWDARGRVAGLVVDDVAQRLTRLSVRIGDMDKEL